MFNLRLTTLKKLFTSATACRVVDPLLFFKGTYNASNDFEIISGADVLLKFNGAGSGATVTDVNVDLTVTGATIATADINGGAIDGTTMADRLRQ